MEGKPISFPTIYSSSIILLFNSLVVPSSSSAYRCQLLDVGLPKIVPFSPIFYYSHPGPTSILAQIVQWAGGRPTLRLPRYGLHFKIRLLQWPSVTYFARWLLILTLSFIWTLKCWTFLLLNYDGRGWRPTQSRINQTVIGDVWQFATRKVLLLRCRTKEKDWGEKNKNGKENGQRSVEGQNWPPKLSHQWILLR